MGKKQTPDEFTGAWRTGEKKKMKKDAKVLTVQDISCFGQCSLTVALPVISAAGIECAVLPSAVLSTHTGGFKGFTFRDLTDDIPGIVSHWEKEGITFDAIYTGYLGSIRQIDLVKDLMDRVLAPGGLRIVDPAMADNGVLYYGFDAGFAAAMAGLCATADVVLPNITEAALMTGLPYRAAGYDEAYITSLCRALTERGAGTVVLTGSGKYDLSEALSWRNITALEIGSGHIVGLTAEGTVVAAGYNKYGQCDVSEWTDIISISAGANHTVGLKSDGTVVAVGYNLDGQCQVSNWKDIIAIAAGGYHTLGLRADGTVVAVGENAGGQCNVADWGNVSAIAAGFDHSIGLRSNGTLLATGSGSNGKCDVGSWKDITAIDAGFDHTVGLKADGTVLATGFAMYGACDVSGWTDIVEITCGDDHTVGLRYDGTVAAVGSNTKGQCNVSDWIKIRVGSDNAE